MHSCGGQRRGSDWVSVALPSAAATRSRHPGRCQLAMEEQVRYHTIFLHICYGGVQKFFKMYDFSLWSLFFRKIVY